MEILDQITTQSPKAALALFLCFIGWAMKRSPAPNWLIPLVLIVLGMVAYPIIAKVQNVDYTSALLTTNVIFGGTIGGASIGLHQILKQTFPVLFPKNGDTTMLKKSDVETITPNTPDSK